MKNKIRHHEVVTSVKEMELRYLPDDRQNIPFATDMSAFTTDILEHDLYVLENFGSDDNMAKIKSVSVAGMSCTLPWDTVIFYRTQAVARYDV